MILGIYIRRMKILIFTKQNYLLNEVITKNIWKKFNQIIIFNLKHSNGSIKFLFDDIMKCNKVLTSYISFLRDKFGRG